MNCTDVILVSKILVSVGEVAGEHGPVSVEGTLGDTVSLP